MPECDRIIMLENGEIVNVGTYEDMIKKNVEFTQFVGKFIDIEDIFRLGTVNVGFIYFKFKKFKKFIYF